MLGKYGLQDVAEINAAGVRIAKEAVAESGKGVWVAGAVGPTVVCVCVLSVGGPRRGVSIDSRSRSCVHAHHGVWWWWRWCCKLT